MNKKTFILVFISCIYLTSALTASLSNAKIVLYANFTPGQSNILEREIQINNPNNISVLISLSSRGDLEGITEFNKNDFIISPGESEKVKFKVTLPSGGDYDGRIAVSFNPADENSKENGVGLATIVKIHADGPVIDYDKPSEPSSPLTSSPQKSDEKQEDEPFSNINILGNDNTPNNQNVEDVQEASVDSTQSSLRSILIGLIVLVATAILVFLIYMIFSKRYNHY